MRFYFNHRKITDYTIAMLAALFVLIQPYRSHQFFNWPQGEGFYTLMLTIGGAGASLLGFVLAANTFLISHTQHDRLKILRQSDGFIQLLEIMKSNLWRLLVLTLVAGLSSIVVPSWTHAALAIVTFLLTLSICALSTLIWSTMSVLAIPLD